MNDSENYFGDLPDEILRAVDDIISKQEDLNNHLDIIDCLAFNVRSGELEAQGGSDTDSGTGTLATENANNSSQNLHEIFEMPNRLLPPPPSPPLPDNPAFFFDAENVVLPPPPAEFRTPDVSSYPPPPSSDTYPTPLEFRDSFDLDFLPAPPQDELFTTDVLVIPPPPPPPIQPLPKVTAFFPVGNRTPPGLRRVRPPVRAKPVVGASKILGSEPTFYVDSDASSRFEPISDAEETVSTETVSMETREYLPILRVHRDDKPGGFSNATTTAAGVEKRLSLLDQSELTSTTFPWQRTNARPSVFDIWNDQLEANPYEQQQQQRFQQRPTSKAYVDPKLEQVDELSGLVTLRSKNIKTWELTAAPQMHKTKSLMDINNNGKKKKVPTATLR